MLVKEIQILCIIKTALAQTAHLRVCKKKGGGVGSGMMCSELTHEQKSPILLGTFTFSTLIWHLHVLCISIHSQLLKGEETILTKNHL